jgi:hypothetical protein
MRKPAKDRFDPTAFLAKVGTGQTILNYRKNSRLPPRRDRRQGLLHSKRQGQDCRFIGARQGGGCRDPGIGPVLWRGLPQWPSATRGDDDGHG